MILIILSSIADTTLSSEEKYFVHFWISFIFLLRHHIGKGSGVNELKFSYNFLGDKLKENVQVLARWNIKLTMTLFKETFLKMNKCYECLIRFQMSYLIWHSECLKGRKGVSAIKSSSTK